MFKIKIRHMTRFKVWVKFGVRVRVKDMVREQGTRYHSADL